ncbi:hypothetical protein EGW08_000359 [Elysia chlorotica]|uniref:Uncharacterized protein n=1 Tax=Elysia chlorotica TaxID=188477 RepID=A0A433UDJ4_ELYCH|nr:hypothetical protein EGW08_000359 [Elysia chlorotica]
MGCASSLSAQESEEIFSEVKRNDHSVVKPVSNGDSIKPASAGKQNGHCTEGHVTVHAESDRETGVLRGDIVKKYEARADRERLLKEKQKKMALAAETMSAQVLDERERLSLTSRSRATSRATSRTASPTGGARSHKEKTLHASIPNIVPEREEGLGKGDNSNHKDSARVIS